MQIQVGFIKKRVNSTKRTMEVLFTTDAILKEPTSAQSPVLLLKIPENMLRQPNYLYISVFASHYWIDSITYTTNDLYELHCHRDALATFSHLINHTKALVKYGDEDHWSKYLDDPRLSPDVTYSKQTINHAFSINDMHDKRLGTVALTVITYVNLTESGIMTYLLLPDQYVEAMRGLNTVYDEVGDIFSGGGNPLDILCSIESTLISKLGGSDDATNFILSATWLPFDINRLKDALIDSGQTVYVYEEGFINLCGIQPSITGNCYGMLTRLGGLVHNKLYDVLHKTTAMPKHPAGNDLPFLNSRKYLDAMLITPSGSTEINATNLCMTADLLTYDWCVSYLNGDWAFALYQVIEDPDYAGNVYTGGDLVALESGNLGSNMAMFSAQGNNMIGTAISAGLSIANNAINVGSSIGAVDAKKEAIASYQQQLAETVIKRRENPDADIKNPAKPTSSGSGITGNFNLGLGLPVRSPSISGATGIVGGIISNDHMFRIVTSHSWPSILNTDPDSEPDSTTALERYKNFCTIYGYPCGQFLELGDITKDSYIECVGADVSNASIGTILGLESESICQPTYEEIASINSYLNTGIYFEDKVEL